MTDIDELERLLAAVTEGPWHVAAYYSGKGPNERCFGMIVSDDDLPTGVIDENDAPDGESLSHDLDLVCSLRNNAPDLIAAYRERDALRAENERLRGAVADYLQADEASDVDAIECSTANLRAIMAGLTPAYCLNAKALGETHDN